MQMDDESFWQQISDAARTEFKRQQEILKNSFKFKPNTLYHCEVCFMLWPDATVSNLRIGQTCQTQVFQAVALRTISCSKFPNPDTVEAIPMSVTFSAATENFEYIQATACIDGLFVRRTPLS
jgi:hypothetical protein